MRRMFCSILFAVALFAPSLASAGTSYKVSVPDHGTLEVDIPSAWRVSQEPSDPGWGDTMRIAPPEGSTFSLLITPVWVPENQRDAQEATMWMRTRLHGQTNEQDTTLQVLKGPRNTVYWFAVTNRFPAPAAYNMMVQGSTMVGELLVGFTFLFHADTTDEGQAVIKAQILSVLSSLGDAKHTGVNPNPKVIAGPGWYIDP